VSLGVLLVEDDRELRTTLRDALKVEGYRVFSSASLADARAVISNALAQGGLDIMLLDLGLPDGDGASLLADLRRQHGTPVIVISARPGEDHKVRLLDEGADDYLVKPFSLAELLARMRVALRHRGTTVHPAISCWWTCGAPSTPSTPTTCAFTWHSCAPSSRPSRPTRACCSPNPAWAIDWSSRRTRVGAPRHDAYLCVPDGQAPMLRNVEPARTAHDNHSQHHPFRPGA